MLEFYSRGKLIITGEYLVLDGVLSLSCPIKKGQWLLINKNNITDKITWNSLNENNLKWFYAEIDKKKISITSSSDKKIANKLQLIFDNIKKTKHNLKDYLLDVSSICSKLEFNRYYGLGSSSTLINNISKWLEIDPYKLQKQVFKGSGYDIACASKNTPITFKINNNNSYQIKEVSFNPSFKSNIFFVYLNKKINSLKSIIKYQKNKPKNIHSYIKQVNEITIEVIKCRDLNIFEASIQKHERLISELLNTQTIKEKLFPDYKGGIIKSLGSWGGDFVMVTGGEHDKKYFRDRGYNKLFNFDELII